MKKISIFGSTGSVGKQTLDIVRNNRKQFEVKVLIANSNIDLLCEQAEEFEPDIIALADESGYYNLKRQLEHKKNIKILAGEEGVLEAASYKDTDIVVSAIVGIAGLKPTYNAISKDKVIALANKETLVTAGNIIMKKIAQEGASIIPVDSEHSAIFQCKIGQDSEISKIILTASGGPFRKTPKEKMKSITVADALKHTNWNMGRKITIDSATLMNKGLEVIEARWLFNIPKRNIEVCIHPESIIHSMVEFIDGSIIAQLGIADMRIAIQYAMTHPKRLASSWESLNLFDVKQLTFEEPDIDRFPCLNLAYDALEQGDSTCIALNAANEVAVDCFLRGYIGFNDIYKLVYNVLEEHKVVDIISLEDVFAVDRWAKLRSKEKLEEVKHSVFR